MLTRANELLYNSHYQEAIQEYDRVIAQSPGQEIVMAAYYNKAQAFDGMGQYSTAAQAYQQIIDVDPTFKSGEIYYEQGQLFQLARMYSECRKAYESFLKFNPKHAECYFNLGQVLETLGEQEQAIQSYEKATEIKPNYGKAYLNKIAILKKLKRNNDILKACQIALHNQPTDFEILYEEGYSLISLQRYKEAIQSLRECIRNNKKYSKAYIALADCYYKLERDNEGLEILRNCLSTNADVLKLIEKKEIKILMGTIYMNIKQYKLAIDCFREVLSQRPINESVKLKLAICLEQYGNFFFSNRQFSDALTCYNQSLNYDNRTSVINNQGLAYQNINNFKDAEKCFNEVLKREPKNAVALNNLASLFHQMGKAEKSKEMFQQLASSNTGKIQIHINSGRSYLSLHKYNQAYAEFSKAITMNSESNNYHLFNDMAVTLQKLSRFQQALQFANKANTLTKNRSPLFLLNRASILMNLQRNNDAKQDFDRAAEELRTPDKANLNQLGINVDNLKYMFSQLNHYAYLMTPINDFRKEILNQIGKIAEPKYSKIVEKVEKAEGYAMSRVITELKKETPQQAPNPEESRQDYNTIMKLMEEAKELKELVMSQGKELKQVKHELNMLKIDSNEIKEKLRYLPQSIQLRQKLQALYDEGDIPIWQYGKQLYWILNGYLKSYMLISTGIVAKGENIDRSTFNKAVKKVTGILEFTQNIPVIGQFSELISRVCGLFVDMEDDVIIQKVYQIISYNYDTEEELNDEICESVLAILNSGEKLRKVREKLTFKPSKDLLQRFSEQMDEVISWFSEKKNEFIMHMRGYQKAENIVQSELAVIDVGAIISILLNTQSNPNTKNRPLYNAAKRICVGEKVEQMVLQAYKRENQNLRVSNNSFCTVMRCQIIYDNPLLNHIPFLRYASKIQNECSANDILNFPAQKYGIASLLLLEERFMEIRQLMKPKMY